MNSHIFLPENDITSLTLNESYKEWLKNWYLTLENNIEEGIISSSECLLGYFVDYLLNKEIKKDWIGIMNEYLVDENENPLAYSEKYGLLLYNFNFWKQTSVHSVHTRWWIEKNINSTSKMTEKCESLISTFIQKNGWIYNPEVSKTAVRTRMKSELMMSLAMGLEILRANPNLIPNKGVLLSNLVSFPNTGYISAEYFRVRALEYLNSIHHLPKNIDDTVINCKASNAFCDFALENKFDDYMGTAKRTSRDKLISSPFLSVLTIYIGKYCSTKTKIEIKTTISEYHKNLLQNPMSIPSFQMRDIPYAFGTGISVIEIISALFILNRGGNFFEKER